MTNAARPSARPGKPQREKRPNPRRQKRVDRIVVVGAGDCGTRAAVELRTRGFEGDLTLVGNEPNVPYERPTLSKAVLTDDGSTPATITSPKRLSELDIRWRSELDAVAVDRSAHEVVLRDASRLPFDRLLIASGARARRPAIAGADVVETLRNLGDASRIRARLQPGVRLLVIGGGFIGLEVAASAVARDCDVHVVEFAHRLMSRVVPAKIAEQVQARHLAAGVNIRCGTGVDSIETKGEVQRVSLTDGTIVDVDVVLAGIGAVPNTELAAATGLTVSNGICVDDRLRTADPAIFAAGDCCSFPHALYGGERVRIEAWRNAIEQAQFVAGTMLGDDEAFTKVPWFWSDQYELGLQIAGLHAAAAYDIVRTREDGVEIRFGLDNDGRVVSASGIAEGSSISRDISLAEMLIARRATPRPTALASPSVGLRELLRESA